MASSGVDDELIEQTLHVANQVCLYRIPSRAPSGHVSGDWRVQDKLFEGRLRVVARGDTCHIRFFDATTGELFAESPVPFGKRLQYVEPAVDSSRNFVVRVQDAASGNHAFLGMGFTDRSDSFDFNESLLRQESQVERERATATLVAAQGVDGAGGAGAPPTGSGRQPSAAVVAAVGSLYANNDDMQLQEGQTIHVNINKKAPKPGGLMSQAAPSLVLGLGLPPPPAPGGSGAPASSLGAFRLAPPP
ncbi:hypothetical protein FOA52_009216 [Chlamydomonas sp. UWO 241]|nr:hypothetical protein FOA52_009216 [Chlamydomonas sp. UWO 241]